MTRAEAERLLRDLTTAWVDDPGSDVVWAGAHEGRWGIRLAQQARDFTTIWFDIGERTLGIEAYVLPAPPLDREQVYRHCLVRNATVWRVHFALDRDGAVYLRGRLPLDAVSEEALDETVGAVYEVIELSFRALVRLGFESREKST
jgi:hypothetical protein